MALDDGGEWSASYFNCFISGTHWIGGWVEPTKSQNSDLFKHCLNFVLG